MSHHEQGNKAQFYPCWKGAIVSLPIHTSSSERHSAAAVRFQLGLEFILRLRPLNVLLNLFPLQRSRDQGNVMFICLARRERMEDSLGKGF